MNNAGAVLKKSPPPCLAWLLNTKKGLEVLKKVTDQDRRKISFVSSYTDANVSENFGVQIAQFCRDHEVPYVPWFELKKRFPHYLSRHRAIGIVAIGWQYLIPSSVWASLPCRLIVFHDSLLPRYRGFAPLASGIINGETEFGLSVLYAGSGIDDGDIILQKKVHISKSVYIGEAIEIFAVLYRDAAIALCNSLNKGIPNADAQDERLTTYSIWRDAHDCRIEWDKTAEEIYNHIRAVGHPYPGAFSYLNGKKVYIWRSQLLAKDVQFEIRDPGKFWRIVEGQPIVVCGSGLLRLTDVADDSGNSLLPVSRLRARFEYK